MTPIEKVIQIAKQEVGYLEKRNGNNLYDKTANAGSNNYTKYWAEIKPSYQGEPWCACFVTWVFVQAFGQEMAKKLLKHYPYVYCPTMEGLFTLNANPKVGDIVIFKHSGTFTHTGIVTSVSGDYFTTVEGNTSGASGIIANGGGVCAKGYYNSSLPGTKFCTPDWNLVKDEKPNFTEYPINKTGIISASELNVRKYPSTASEVLAKHVMGDQVTICAETDNGWYKVNYPFGAGYISKDYVRAYDIPKEEEFTQGDFNRLFEEYVRGLASQQPSSWSSDARAFCENKGIINGDENGNKRYKSFLTREELITALYSLVQKGIK